MIPRDAPAYDNLGYVDMALCNDVLFRDLRLPEQFLDEFAGLIRKKLVDAAADLDQEHGDIFAINQCLHLASSIVLRNAKHLDETLAKIRSIEGFAGMDPTTVVTIATFYVILRGEQRKVAKDKELTTKLKRLHGRFDEINWLIGRAAMETLGIEPL